MTAPWFCWVKDCPIWGQPQTLGDPTHHLYREHTHGGHTDPGTHPNDMPAGWTDGYGTAPMNFGEG